MIITLPGGWVDTSVSSTRSAVKRELLEGTGYCFDDWRLVYVVFFDPKIEHFICTCLATGQYAKGPTTQDSGERISAKRLARSRCLTENLTVERLISMTEFEGEELEVDVKRETID